MRPAGFFGRLAVALFCAGAFGRSALAQDVSGLERGRGLEQVEEEISSVPFVLEGSVLEPDGAPAEGAVVVSSAGGQAVAGPDGGYRLEVRMSLDAESVHVMAVGSSAGSMRASSSISIAPTAGHAWVAPLQLAQEGTCAPSWLPTFGQAPGTDNGLFVLAVFDDGTGSALYMGGPFENPARHIAKWNGTRWEPLGTGIHSPSPLDHTVHALAVYDDGSGSALYVGGLFREAGGTQAHGIAMWDGTSWSALGAGTGGAGGGIDESVLALAVYDDGSGSALYAGGDFAELGCDPGNRIARWDGSSWTTLGTGLNGPVEDLAVYDDGGGPALYAGGSFTTAGGLPANRIARWDGSSWSALGSGLSSSVYALTVYDDGSGSALHAGGAFSTAGGVAASRIARWDGSTWTPLGSGMGSNIVRSLAVHDDGSGSALYAGGSFSTAGGVTVNGIARWNGSSWTALGNGVAPLGFWGVPALAVYDDGSGSALYAGGGFSSAGGVAVDGIATWDGSSWSALGSGMGGPIHALAVYDDGGGKALYAGGFFRRAGATAADRVAKWDGSIWSPLGSGVSLGVLCLAVWNDGTGDDLYVGGRFGQAGGMSAGHIAKWDGASWSPLGSGTNAQSEVTCLAVYGPALYVGGDFALAGGNPSAQRIAKWDGTS